MTSDIYKIVLFLVLLTGCRPSEPEWVPLPTSLSILVQHHNVPIPHLPVYLKYDTQSFPGYDDPEKWADTALITDASGRLTFQPLPEGQHWLVATGIDSLPLPHLVFGSLPFFINLNTKPKLDTVIYVSE